MNEPQVPSTPDGLEQRTQQIFHEFLAVPEAEWPALLESRCGSDTALMAELRSLLDACQAEEMLSAEWSATACAKGDGHGRLIGPYELDRLLGRGGMGAVYLAHRADGEFEQQVAIKLVDLPLATELFRERFRMERQILAGLVHPFIARLLDGGVSAEGELYLAMEYVDGVSIARYCAEKQLTLHERLMLFRHVCEAVQFAHQNLVVHRDLKPDNILVVADGTPRLLDFGTAKLLAPPTADAAEAGFTQHGLQSFTPQYASPEQVMGDRITTASDTYSLGVLLYLLLAGVPPYELKEFTTAEMMRVICTEQPPKPSARGATDHIDADLDAIVLKALRKEPQRRYLTVEQFSADIQAYLDRRPVTARRGTMQYRAGKFVRRNKLALVAAALLFASVVAGLAGVLYQRQRAEARSADLRQLSNSLLSEIDEAVKQLPGSTPVQRLIVQRVLEHLDRMSKDADGDRQTQLDLVDAYTRLGNLQGNPYDQNIGDATAALVSLDKARVIAESLRTTYPKDAEVLGALALAQQSRSEVLFGLGNTQEAVVSMRAAVQAFEARAARPGATAAQIADASTANGGLGDQLGQSGVASLGDPDGAVIAYRRGMQLSELALSVDPSFVRSQRAVAIDHLKIGNVLTETDATAAIGEYHAALAAWNRLPEQDKGTAATLRGISATYRHLGLALAEARDYQGAIAAFNQGRGTTEYFAAADATDARAQFDLAVSFTNEAMTYVDMLNPVLSPRRDNDAQSRQFASARMHRAIEILSALIKVNPKNVAWSSNLAYSKVVGGTLEEAARPGTGTDLTASGLSMLGRNADSPDASIEVRDLMSTAVLTALPTRLRNAQAGVRYAEKLVNETHRRKVNFLLTLAQAYDGVGEFEKCRAAAQEGLALLAPSPEGSRPRSYVLLESELHAGTINSSR